MNHVWKVPALPSSAVILKHAPPYIATVPEVELDDSRIIFEAEALQAFLEGGNWPPGSFSYPHST